MPRVPAVKVPITADSTPRRFISPLNSPSLSPGTDTVMRSCDSESQICHGPRPGYLSGTLSRSTSKPPHSRAISATEHERPPAPLSVIEL